MTSDAGRSFSFKSALLQRLVPDLDLTYGLGPGLKLKASVRTHPGFLRASHRRREAGTAAAIAGLAPRGGVIYDIGANIGLYTVVFATSGARRVIAFEPSALVLPYLRQNITLNRLDNVDVTDIVLSDAPGQVRFTLDRTTTCTSHVSAEGEPGVMLTSARLDDLIVQRSLPLPDVLKIDVEGHDLAVLRGMKHLLTDRRPIVCLEGGLRLPDGRIPGLSFLRECRYDLRTLDRTRAVAHDTDEYVVVGVPAS